MKLSVRMIAGALMLAGAWLAPLGGQSRIDPTLRPDSIQIIRDEWGVPHIYAPTDPEVAYGLAWAHAEDDFQTLQHMFMLVRGRYGEVAGREGAALDFILKFLKLPQRTARHYRQDLSPDCLALLKGYCRGANRYARQHPEAEIDDELFPMRPLDMAIGYQLTAILLQGFPFAQRAGMEDELEDFIPGYYLLGSNAIALNANKTADDKVYLAVNSHQPMTGLFSWYEVHLHSDEGLNITGGVFPGSATILHGTTPTHGWAATLNYLRLYDYYKLQINPDNSREYRYDGRWLKLHKRKIRLKVELFLGIALPVKRTVYESAYGPVIKSKDGHYYAFRVSGLQGAGVAEQMYRMNKAEDLEAFKEAMQLGHLASGNFVWADHENNIFMLSNCRLPRRDTSFRWEGLMPGDTSGTHWHQRIGFEQMPRYQNPPCGYLFNTNNTPLQATCPAANLPRDSFPAWYKLQQNPNNRSLRLQTMLSESGQVDWQRFKAMKYDLQYSPKSGFVQSMQAIVNSDPAQYPKRLRPVLAAMQGWDYRVDTNSTHALPVLLTVYKMFEVIEGGTPQIEEGLPTRPSLIEKGLRFAHKFLKRNYGSYEVPLGRVQRLSRGHQSYAVNGAPAVVAAIYSNPDLQAGKLRPYSGESYIQLVRFDQEGLDRFRTIHAYGASQDPASPHYNDQMKRFAHQELKQMTFDKEQLLEEADNVYHPGTDGAK